MNVFLLLNTKDDILKNIGAKQLMDHIDLQYCFPPYYGSQTSKCLVIHILQKILSHFTLQ